MAEHPKAPKPQWWRRFDLEYRQMREALGYPIPDWVDRRWPRKLNGNFGNSPYACGSCEARKRYPATNISCDIAATRRRLEGDERKEFEERIIEAIVAEPASQ